MRIVVDLQSNQSGSRKGGIGRYSFDLLTAMIQSRPDWDFRVVLNDLFPERTNEIRYRLRNFLPQSHIHAFKAPENCAPANGSFQLTEAAEFLREKFIADLNPDVIHITSVIEGLFEDVVTSVKRFFDIPTVSTLYDLIPLARSDLYLSDIKARSHYFEKVRELKKSDGLLAISQYSADEWRAVFPNYTGGVYNIRGGIDKGFNKKILDPSVVNIRKKYKLDKKIILYTASFDQRKNQSGLIEAFSTLPQDIRASHQLVFVGNGWSGIYDRLHALGRARGIPRDDIRFLGHVPDSDLIWLYNICDVFVFPPKWEGLGMPALEARACGAVVIGSNTTSIPEVIGWDEALFDPNDPIAMGQKMLRAIADQKFRQENRARGEALVAQYQWSLSADVAVKAIEEVVKARRSSLHSPSGNAEPVAKLNLAQAIFAEELFPREIQEVSFCAAANDIASGRVLDAFYPKRGWITTWNSRCGIATYSEHILAETKSRPVIFAPYVEEVVNAKKDVNVVRCWQQGKDDTLNELEAAIYESGVSEVVIQFNYGFFDLTALKRMVERLFSNGVSTYFVLHSTVDQDPRPEQRLSAIWLALHLSNGIFVHSVNDVRRLAELGLTTRVTLLPHGIPLVAQSTTRRVNKAKTIIASYGFFLPGKGLVELIEAAAIVAKTSSVELWMVNAYYPEISGLSRDLIQAAKEKIGELQIEDKVKIYSDFLSDEESFDLLSQAEIIVYPYTRTGESASGAVRLGLSTRRLVAVSPLSIFDDVRDCVYTLPSVDSVGIASGLTRALELLREKDPEIEAIKRNSRRLAEVNSYKNIARALEGHLTVRGSCSAWYEVFRLELDSPHISSGVVSKGRLLSQGAGVLCHGPYLNLSPGIYRLTVHGAAKKKGGAITLRCTADCGSTVISGGHELDGSGEGVLLDTVLCVSQKLKDLEFIIETTRDAELSLSTYSLSKRSH